MTSEELYEKLNEIQKMKCESQVVELKSAAKGCSTRLYDTLSSFSNQDEGGVIYFGIDEDNDYPDTRGSFIVKFYKESKQEAVQPDDENNLILYCRTPRTRKEICDYLGMTLEQGALSGKYDAGHTKTGPRPAGEAYHGTGSGFRSSALPTGISEIRKR